MLIFFYYYYLFFAYKNNLKRAILRKHKFLIKFFHVITLYFFIYLIFYLVRWSCTYPSRRKRALTAPSSSRTWGPSPPTSSLAPRPRRWSTRRSTSQTIRSPGNMNGFLSGADIYNPLALNALIIHDTIQQLKEWGTLS